MQFPAIKNWQFGEWLTRATADYYLLVDAYMTAENRGNHQASKLEAAWQSHALAMANEIAKYLIMACAGEMRHSGLLKQWGHKGYARSQVWEKAFAKLEGKSEEWVSLICAGWAEQFIDKRQFQGSVGGKLWGQASQLTADYLSGEHTPVMYVEFTLNLHHNCARIFNKLHLPDGFMHILDAGFAGIADADSKPNYRAKTVLTYATPEGRSQWQMAHSLTDKELAELIGGKGSTPTPTPGAVATDKLKKALHPAVSGASDYSPQTPEKLW
jgi:hypothetical protein